MYIDNAELLSQLVGKLTASLLLAFGIYGNDSASLPESTGAFRNYPACVLTIIGIASICRKRL